MDRICAGKQQGDESMASLVVSGCLFFIFSDDHAASLGTHHNFILGHFKVIHGDLFGTLSGSNVELYRRLSADHPELRFQASGGIGDLDDVRALASVALEGVIVGKALLEKKFTLAEALAC